MLSSNRRAFACILLALATASFAHAQKDQPASISGKVTIKNKAVAGVVVVATNSDYGWPRLRYRGTTDDDGNYRINNVPAGNYQIYPVALALVVEDGQPKQTLIVAAGENIRDINFAMVRGGVITGKITDAEGQPLIEQTVNVTPVELQFERMPENVQTDDRGVYRIFGLRGGRYKVSVGQPHIGLPGHSRPFYPQTFYPSVTDPEKATLLEVTEGSEIQNIDIVTSSPISTFRITGRIIDGETSKPLPNISFGIHQTDGNSSVSSSGGAVSDANGEFKLENARPGTYTLFAVQPQQSDWHADPLKFEVVDKDVTGLEVKTRKAASLAGVLVVEGADNKPGSTDIGNALVLAAYDHPSLLYNPIQTARVNPDGSFKIGGLRSGRVRLSVSHATTSVRLDLVSVEQNGVPQTAGIDVNDGEQVAGIRVVVKAVKLTSAIRGQVKFENGEPSADARISVSARFLDENSAKSQIMMSSSSSDVDARGHFVVKNLAAGAYELTVLVYQPGSNKFDVTKQQVTVTENAVTDVTVTVRFKQ